MRWALATWLLGCLIATPAFGQEMDDKSRREIERMVGDGMIEALDGRFKGERTLEQLRWLALAHANKAAQVRDPQLRFREFESAEKRYERWLAVAEAKAGDTDTGAAALAAGKLDYAAMILSRWAAPDLDDFEMTGGRRGDPARLIGLLHRARELYEQCRQRIAPLLKQAETSSGDAEDKLLLTGLRDTLKRLDLDSKFSLSWTHLYLAVIDAKNAEGRAASLRAAERGFQEVIDSGVPLADTAARCYLGLAITLREQARYEPAERQFGLALQQQPSGPLEAQIRHERAKGQFAAGKFDDARATLRPLLEKDTEHLAAEDRPARFYLNLAGLWDAYGYLLEAAALEKTAQDSAGREALLRRAERTRETGIAAMNRLATRGGPWPGLVQLYVASTIRTADPKMLSPAELLFSARQLSEEKRYREAIERLAEAAERKTASPEIAADIRFELATNYYRNQQLREAAMAFEQFCREYKNHAQAAASATYAYQIWSSVADKSRDVQDYQRMADLLLHILTTFPEHPQREDCMWWLPLALQGAQRYADAAVQFANVPQKSPRWEEAQYRRLQCLRSVLESERDAAARASYEDRAGKLAQELIAYSKGALNRAKGGKEDAPRRWAAQALAAATELLVSPEVNQPAKALDAIATFEQDFPESDGLGRVLAVRVRALRALKRMDEAARVVDEYLKGPSRGNDGGVLAIIAQGMQEEIDRLELVGRDAAARQLAIEAVPTFEQLQNWVRADQARVKYLKAVSYGLARMYTLAGEPDKARPLVASLLFQEPRNGSFIRLNALVLEAIGMASKNPKELAAGRDAWANLLSDPDLRKEAPEQYWEARYHLLYLLLIEGRGAEVRKAIEQEQIWYPDLGGPRWQARFHSLLGEAGEPASRPAP